MFSTAIEKISKSVFPILFQSGTSIGLSGTGFFIDNQGTFMSVLHVATGIPPGSRIKYAGLLPDQQLAPVDIQEIYRDDTKDIFIGKVAASSTPVNFFSSLPKIGTSVCLGGYPMGAVRRYWKHTHVLDYQSIKIDPVTHDAIIVECESFPGMSGCPVFNVAGEVVGMNVGSYHRDVVLNIKDKDGKNKTHPLINGIVIKPEYLRQAMTAAGLP